MRSIALRLTSLVLTALFSHSAWALEYEGTVTVAKASDGSRAILDTACASSHGAGARVATAAEMVLVGISNSSIGEANVYATNITNVQTNETTNFSVDGYSGFLNDDGAGMYAVMNILSCTGTDNGNTFNPQYSSTNGFSVSATSRCGGTSAPWHCVSGEIGGSGSGDNLGNHTATQALNMGGFAVNGASGYFHSSDAALKANISKLSGWEILKHITGYSYDWKNGGGRSAGVLAQEVEKVLPSAVATDKITGTKSVEYDQLIAPMIEAIKEMNGKIDALEEDNRALREKVTTLEHKDSLPTQNAN